jgi:micrococcal nuclease
MNKCLKLFSRCINTEISTNWDEITDKVPAFSLEGFVKKCKVVSVYDGDTIKVVFPIHDKMYKWNCRLNGVDTPELRTRDELEKKYGYKVRDLLREKILNKIVTVRCGDFDKYGRLLIDIYCENEETSVSFWLIENKYAFKYGGGTKQKWGSYLRQHKLN